MQSPKKMINSLMHRALTTSLLLLCACNNSPQTPPPAQLASPQATLLDEVLVSPAFSNEISQAERDLPDDKWEQQPYRFNASRAQREIKVADMMLQDIKPKLKQLTVTELVRALKVLPY